MFIGISRFALFLGLTLCVGASASAESQLLQRLVDISSGSENTAGVDRVQQVVAAEVGAMGFQTTLESNPAPGSHTGKMLIATKKGTDPAYITLITHADTVFEKSSGFEGFKVSPDGKTAHGPGVADDKGGLVVALSGLRQYLATKPTPHYSLRLLVSPSEETGTVGFIPDFKRFSRDSVMVLGFEPSVGGAIIDSRRGNRWYHIHVQGKEAHGADRSGLNACVELAMKLERLYQLNDPASNITVSIGHMEGGKDKYNIVCGEASAKVDSRFADPTSSETLRRQFDSILDAHLVKGRKGLIATTTYEIADESPSFPANEVSRPYVHKYTELISAVEKSPCHSRISVGSADSNYFYRDGLVIMDGLGPEGEGEHTSEERVSMSSLVTRSQAFAQFLTYTDGAHLQ